MRYVVAVAEEGTFTRAAARCFVVQSALSHQIKSLEKELGVTLFARTSRRVELTAAGEAFLPAARDALAAAERAAADAAAATGQIRGRLTIGVIPTVTAVDVPTTLRDFHLEYPQVRIALHLGASNDIASAIARGEIDVGMLGLPTDQTPRGVAWRRVVSDRGVAVMSPEHRLAGRTELQIADLAQEVFADFPTRSPGRMQNDLAFAAAGVSRDVAFEVMVTDLMIGLVRQNLAITLLPSRFAPTDPGLVTIPVIDGPARDEYLAWSDFNPSPAAQAFLSSIAALSLDSPSS